MRARTTHRVKGRTTPFGTALVGLLLGVALAVSGCAWGSSASDRVSPAANEATGDEGPGDGRESDEGSGDGRESDGPVAVGSPIVTPSALEAADGSNTLGFVQDLLETWAEDNCDDPDCLRYEVDPEDATDECIYLGSDPGPREKVKEGSTVVLFADCDEDGSGEDGSGEDGSGEDTTGEDTTGEDTTGEDTTEDETPDDDVGGTDDGGEA